MLEARVEPRRIGRYTLVAKLASGGMATVYLAQAHGELGFARLCAVKIIHPHLLDQPEFLARFLHEGKVASGIRHPHVVSVLDVGQAGDTPYLVLDYVRGASLAELMRRAEDEREPPTLEVACAIVKEALEGLHAVHTATDEDGSPLGLIHRDVSHDNLLLSTDGVTYVTDLGIARARGVALTRATGLLGKAGYISPEQLAKEPLTAKVDLFAAGVVLWELLTQRRLFPDLEAELPMLTGTFQLEPASRTNPRVNAALDAFIARLLARRPDDRPRSAGAAAQELARIVQVAPREEVSEWVRILAEPRLERLDAIVRDAKAASVPPPAVSSSPDLSGALGPRITPARADGLGPAMQSGEHPRAAMAHGAADVAAPATRRGAGAGAVAGALGVIALAALGGIAWKSGLVGPRSSVPTPTTSAKAPPETASAPAASSVAPPASTPEASAPALPPVTSAASAKAAPRPSGRPGAKGSRPTATTAASSAAPTTTTAPPKPVDPGAERL